MRTHSMVDYLELQGRYFERELLFSNGFFHFHYKSRKKADIFTADILKNCNFN